MTIANGPAAVPPAPPAAATVSRSGRLAATVVSGWLRMVVTTGVGLVATPVLVGLLGADRFGAVRMAEQWMAYLEFLSFGLGGAVSVLVLRAATAGAVGDTARTARSGMRRLARQFWWVLPAAAGMVAVFPVAFGLSDGLRAEYYLAAPAVLLGVSLGPLVPFRAILEARQQGYLLNVGLTVQALTAAGLGVWLASAGFGLTGQLWAGVLGTVALFAVCGHFAGATGPGFWSGPPIPLGADLWRLQWPLLVVGVGNQINLLSDGLLAGAAFGVAPVAGLLLTQRLFQLATVVAGSVGGAGTWAGLLDLRARVGPDAFAARVVEVSKLNAGVNLLVMAPVLACNQRFVGMWVGDGLYAGDSVTLATFAQLAVFNFFCLHAALLDALGQTRRRVWVSTAGTVLKLALFVPLASWFGLVGLPLASAIAYLCTDAWYCPLALSRAYNVPAWAVARGAAQAAAVGGGWAAVCFLAGCRSGPHLPGWSSLLAEAAVLEVAGLVLGWALLLSSADRRVWRDRVGRWVGRAQ